MLVRPNRLFFVLSLILLLFSNAAAEQAPIRPGDPFPELRLNAPPTEEERAYLQLGVEKIFTPSQVKGELLLIELLNVHCPHCQMQAPSYNELFKRIEANPETRGKIKMLGFAAGNLPQEVEDFRQNYRVDFPIIADPGFAAWRAIGGSATPFTLYVRQTEPGQAGIVTGIHRGLNTHYAELYQQLIAMAATDPADLHQQAQEIDVNRQIVPPGLTDRQLEYRVRTAFTAFGMIEDFSRLSLLSGRRVYSAMLRRGESRERLFAEVASRTSVCDICHDVHFIYLFDASTRVLGFEPLQLTKYGNVNWNASEVKTMRDRVVGRFLSMPRPFDPSIDAISSATMTSAIIFDSLAQGDTLIKELHAQGLM